MQMLARLYEAIAPYLAVVGLSTLSAGVIFGAVYGAVKLVGEKWVASKFNERLEIFKHAQQREIEELKFQINASMDRAVKLHQREFETLPEVWSTLVSSFSTVRAFIAPFQSYPDLARMSEAEREEFLGKSELGEYEKNEVRNSSDRNKTYQEIIFWHGVNTCRTMFRNHHTYLLKNSIFLLPEMKEKFKVIGNLIWDALIEHQINHEMREWRDRPHTEKLNKEGDAMLTDLEQDIQKRLWNGVSLS